MLLPSPTRENKWLEETAMGKKDKITLSSSGCCEEEKGREGALKVTAYLNASAKI